MGIKALTLTHWRHMFALQGNRERYVLEGKRYAFSSFNIAVYCSLLPSCVSTLSDCNAWPTYWQTS